MIDPVKPQRHVRDNLRQAHRTGSARHRIGRIREVSGMHAAIVSPGGVFRIVDRNGHRTTRKVRGSGQVDIERPGIGDRVGAKILGACWKAVGISGPVSQFREIQRLSVIPSLRIQLINVHNDVREGPGARRKGPLQV